ncbi:MAG: hypothetical protein KC910_34265, partial [Candidatus Eremiobacteraeota bacterium]|nr:hypothetical protein [Candidatus Eremiobacteraeota bacterium]
PFTFPRFEARCEEFADEEGRVCRSVKTNRRRYDLAVTCLLLIAKHYLGDQLTVLSANREAWWDETREICQRVLGYGEGMYVGEPWSCSVDTSDPRSPAAHAAWLLKQKDKLAMVPES